MCKTLIDFAETVVFATSFYVRLTFVSDVSVALCHFCHSRFSKLGERYDKGWLARLKMSVETINDHT